MKIHTFTLSLWTVLACVGTVFLNLLTPFVTTIIIVALGAPVLTAIYLPKFAETIHKHFERDSK